MNDRINIGGLITDAFYFETLDASDGGNAIGESFAFGEGELDTYFSTFRHDKELVWATPYGGDGQDYIEKLVRGEWGNTGNHLYALGRAGNNIGETEMTWPAETSYTGSEYYYKDEYTDVVSPTVHSYDGYIIKFNYDRDIVFSTLFGGDGSDEIYDGGFSNNSEIWFSGRTNSDNTSFPYTPYTGYYDDQDDLETTDVSDQNAFVSVLTPVSILNYATYYGNTQNTSADCLAVQPYGFDNHVITAGQLKFKNLEEDGFTPLWSIFEDTYSLEENPYGTEAVLTAHITEWGPFSIAEEITLDSFDDNIFIYPNPSSDYITLSLAGNSVDLLTIHSMEGVELFRMYFIEMKEVIDVSHFPSGVYIVSILKGNNALNVKLVKQ